MAAALAAMLGQIGLPGGGVGYGYGAVGLNGHPVGSRPSPSSSGQEPGDRFHPGGSDRRPSPPRRRGVRLQRQAAHLPDTHLVYWAGGNPFHHHQDLNRLARAWQVPDTMICHEPFWNPWPGIATSSFPPRLPGADRYRRKRK